MWHTRHYTRPLSRSRATVAATAPTKENQSMTAKRAPNSAAASKNIMKRIQELGDWRGATLAWVRQLIHDADPEIQDMKRAKPIPEDVIFRLSPRGGPPPEAELLFHAQRAQEYGHTWVGLRRPRNPERVRCGTSRIYLITSEARPRKIVLRCRMRNNRLRHPPPSYDRRQTVRYAVAEHAPALQLLGPGECVALGCSRLRGRRGIRGDQRRPQRPGRAAPHQ